MSAKLVICIPTLAGHLSAWTHASVMSLSEGIRKGIQKDGKLLASAIRDCERETPEYKQAEARILNALDVQIADTWLWPYDLARVRSRAVRKFLADTDATHLLFVDADVQFEPYVIRRMLDTGKDIVACPYPKRDVRWDLAYEAAKEGQHPEIGAYEYVFRALEPVDSKTGLVKVAGVGMGCTLLSRECLQRMVTTYGFPPETRSVPIEDLRAFDNHPTHGGETVMLFAMQWGEMNGKRHLFGEDLSFCNRARAIGIGCYLYVGDGAPASHHGSMLFRGTPEGMARDMGRGDEGRKPK